ncbi:MAG: hypothetical protein KKE23_03780 [Nanoarchaeota archaeon]|nr:hypothetical protein [Nanoarchaeota archaeon]
MRIIRKFEGFIEDGVVKIQNPDLSRAKFLIQESENGYLFLKELIEKFPINYENANSVVKLCYDIIMELIRAKMLKAGFNASGQGAHEAEVSYLRKLNFDDKDIQTADQLRYFRNGITYYGKILDKEYAEEVLKFLDKIRKKLLE